MRRREGNSWTPVFDYMLAMLGLFLIWAIVSVPKTQPRRIDTQGIYAITMTSPKTHDDIDLWVRDPNGNICYYGNTTAGLMHLQQDVIPGSTDSYGHYHAFHGVREETIIQGTIPGEYVVNIVLYNKTSPGSVSVKVELWSLRGWNRQLHHQEVILHAQKEESTAFRFTLNPAGDAGQYTRLPKKLLYDPLLRVS